ncbi:MAG: iron-containing alcohol dehydrogenase [Kiritimatiellales bacterium]|nr:iron-containing alcohol dehydrogenase [Kiritimatiellales bacterium]
MKFEFATSQRIVFGPGVIGELPGICADFGKKPAFITGNSTARSAPVFQALENRGFSPRQFSVCGEPTIGHITGLVQQIREQNCGFVIAIGGGSVIDAGKAIAALLTNPGNPMDYLEVVGSGQPLKNRAAPLIAVPTTAGTGAEVTRNAVLLSEEHNVKVSMRSPLMLPALALVDPELTMSMPPAITASTGLDALTQLIEAFVSVKSNPLTDGICREGIRKAGRALPRAYADGSDAAAREDMALASLFGGLALANAGLGAVHGFAGPLGGMFHVPHGTVCAALLPMVVKTNFQALEELDKNPPILGKFRELETLLGSDGFQTLEKLCAELNVPGLSSLGVKKADFPHIIEQAKNASSMKGNPVPLSDDQLLNILVESY